MVHPHRPLAAWIQAGCTDPGTAGSESCSARNSPLGWPAVGCFAWRQRSGVTVAWAIVASFRALPALVVRVGLPPARLPLGGTLCRPPPLVEGCPLLVAGPPSSAPPLPSPAPSPWLRVRVGSVSASVGLGFGPLSGTSGLHAYWPLSSASRLPSVCAPSALRGLLGADPRVTGMDRAWLCDASLAARLGLNLVST